MTQVELTNAYSDVPETIDTYIDMPEANTKIKIYEGTFLLKNNALEIQVNGSITFKWLPNAGVIFSGNLLDNTNGMFKLVQDLNELDIEIEGLELGKGVINSVTYRQNIEIEGSAIRQVVLGDISIAVNRIRFSLPNFREVFGSLTKRITEANVLTSQNRLQFENDSYTITIDKCYDFKKRYNSLKQNGGYIILYNGEILSKKKAVTLKSIEDLISCLNVFFTFINGRRVAMLFVQGLHEEQIIWTDYSNYNIDGFRYVQSWYPFFLDKLELDKLWDNFYSLWKKNKDVLNTAVHWYIEANAHSGFIEGSIIMAQTALELLYNWWIVENKKLIIGKDSESISAANKIRLLTSQLNIDHTNPLALPNLQSFIKSNSEITDVPEAIVQIRNAIVHSQEEKRKKLSLISSMAKYEALQVFIWYIELILLRILNFDNKYFNRCSGEITSDKAEMLVPWSKGLMS